MPLSRSVKVGVLTVCAIAGIAGGVWVERVWPSSQAQCIVLLLAVAGLVLGGMCIHYWTLTEPKYKPPVVEDTSWAQAETDALVLEDYDDYNNGESVALVLEEDAV